MTDIKTDIERVFGRPPPDVVSLVESNLVSLTPREQQVLKAWVQGLSAKSSARALAISPRTIETHRQRLRRKLGVQSVVQMAVALAEISFQQMETAPRLDRSLRKASDFEDHLAAAKECPERDVRTGQSVGQAVDLKTEGPASTLTFLVGVG